MGTGSKPGRQALEALWAPAISWVYVTAEVSSARSSDVDDVVLDLTANNTVLRVEYLAYCVHAWENGARSTPSFEEFLTKFDSDKDFQHREARRKRPELNR